MARKNYFDILDSMEINADREFQNLNYLLDEEVFIDIDGNLRSIRYKIEREFKRNKRRKSFLSFGQVVETFGLALIKGKTLEDLYLFSEMLIDTIDDMESRRKDMDSNSVFTYYEHIAFETELSYDTQLVIIRRTIDNFLNKTNHEFISIENGRQIIVEKNSYASEAAQIVSDTDLSSAIKVLEYNHFANKGNVERKADILISLAGYLEPLRSDLESDEKLKEILKVNNKKVLLVNNLFEMYNSFGLRHNNDKQLANGLTDEELEKWYDDIYTSTLMTILAKEQSRISREFRELKVDCM